MISFNVKYLSAELIKSQKAKKGMSKKKLKKLKRAGKLQEDGSQPTSTESFNVDTQDPRFQRLFDDPSFAIDPTNHLFVNFYYSFEAI